jgi:hypothetical protein
MFVEFTQKNGISNDRALCPISFPTRIRLGTKHRMYACVRTYGYEDTMRVRLVVEKKNERDTTVIGRDMGV